MDDPQYNKQAGTMNLQRETPVAIIQQQGEADLLQKITEIKKDYIDKNGNQIKGDIDNNTDERFGRGIQETLGRAFYNEHEIRVQSLISGFLLNRANQAIQYETEYDPQALSKNLSAFGIRQKQITLGRNGMALKLPRMAMALTQHTNLDAQSKKGNTGEDLLRRVEG